MSQTNRRIPSWVLPAGLAALVVALVAIALLRGPAVLDPDTPEGTVQEYLTAISEERWDDAIEILHEDWQGECEGPDLASHVHEDFTAQLGDQTGFGSAGFGVGPEGQDVPPVPDDATRVEVTLDHGDSGSLGSGWRELTVFELVDGEGFWWLVGDPWPYFVWSCRGSQ